MTNLCDEPEFPCHQDPDEPCPCGAADALKRPPKRQVRYSAQFVEQARDLSGDRRFPLRAVLDKPMDD